MLTDTLLSSKHLEELSTLEAEVSSTAEPRVVLDNDLASDGGRLKNSELKNFGGGSRVHLPKHSDISLLLTPTDHQGHQQVKPQTEGAKNTAGLWISQARYVLQVS